MNVACNSPDTVSHRAFISLELQRLRTLLKIHSIELHAKLLRARELPALLPAHVDPMACAWTRYCGRGPLIRAWAAPCASPRRTRVGYPPDPRVGGAAQAHILGLACVSRG